MHTGKGPLTGTGVSGSQASPIPSSSLSIWKAFDVSGQSVRNDWVGILDGLVGYPFRDGAAAVELYANYGNYAAQSGSGFESRQLGLRFRWSF